MKTSVLFALVFPVIATCKTLGIGSLGPRTFQIDYTNNQFLKDGKPFQYISGSIHYYRSTEEQWDSLLRKCRLGGLNTISINIPWNMHQETDKLEFNYNGNRNLFKFIEIAKKNDLLVIVRAGPYIDSDRNMGGLPPWLLWTAPGIKLRSSDPAFLSYVCKWFDELLPKLRPYLYENGGPVISMQIENGYGGYGCDKTYLSYLRDLVRRNLGPNLVIFTTDGPKEEWLQCGSVEGVYATTGFAPDSAAVMNSFFAKMREVSPNGPLVCSEFYSGGPDRWQYPHVTTSAEAFARALDILMGEGASVNIYLYHGGTNFAFGNGAKIDNGTYDPFVTSYDFDAPLSEAGDPTAKYFAIKTVIQKYFQLSPLKAKASPKLVGRVELKRLLSSHTDAALPFVVNQPQKSSVPMSYEDLHQCTGFVVYEVKVPFVPSDPILLNATELKGRAFVMVNHTILGILSRQGNITALPIRVRQNDTIAFYVEDEGRVSNGENLGESIGLGNNVTLGGKQLFNWTQVAFKRLSNETLVLNESDFPPATPEETLMEIRNRGAGIIYTGNFTVEANKKVADTFVRFDGFSKGVIWVNGFSIGRYWPVGGPQVTLFLPGYLLKPSPHVNQFIVFELESSPQPCYIPTEFSKLQNQGDCFISLTDKPELDGPTAFPSTIPLNNDMAT